MDTLAGLWCTRLHTDPLPTAALVLLLVRGLCKGHNYVLKVNKVLGYSFKQGNSRREVVEESGHFLVYVWF